MSRLSGGHKDWDVDSKIYIGGLDEKANRRSIEEKFGHYGKVLDVWVAQKPPGFAFVAMETVADAEDAVHALDGTKICGARVRVEMSNGGSMRKKRDKQTAFNNRNRFTTAPNRKRGGAGPLRGIDNENRRRKSERSPTPTNHSERQPLRRKRHDSLDRASSPPTSKYRRHYEDNSRPGYDNDSRGYHTYNDRTYDYDGHRYGYDSYGYDYDSRRYDYDSRRDGSRDYDARRDRVSRQSSGSGAWRSS